MDHTTFENDEVADYINSHFTPVRADNDRRPDLNARYNMGGWPTVVFLMPTGEVLTGATYLPPRQMMDMMSTVTEMFTKDKEALAQKAAQILRDQQESLSASGKLSDTIPGDILRAMESAYDVDHGGFGAQQKFPHIPALEMLLLSYKRTRNELHLEMAARTLRAMAGGGVFDPEEGGFFRYSTTRDWSIPHFEKMLEDNAGLLNLYVLAYSITADDFFIDVARDINRYLERVLLDQHSGAFFGSQDADEHYYRLKMDERVRRVSPSVDRTIYANWNGVAADAYLRTYESTGDSTYLSRALGVIGFVTGNMLNGGMFYHYYDTEAREQGIFSDQVWMGLALVRAYECTGERRYLEIARATADVIIGQFSDPAGGFFDIAEERRAAQMLPQREKSIDEESAAARFLVRLAHYGRNPVYREAAEAALRSIAGAYASYGILAAPYGLAVREVLGEPVRIAIAGSREDPRTQALIDASFRYKAPSSFVDVLAEEDASELEELGIEPSERPKAAVCLGASCKVADDAAELNAAIREAGG
jgi:uncharacterized protein YyaL (SSP411 family)